MERKRYRESVHGGLLAAECAARYRRPPTQIFVALQKVKLGANNELKIQKTRNTARPQSDVAIPPSRAANHTVLSTTPDRGDITMSVGCWPPVLLDSNPQS